MEEKIRRRREDVYNANINKARMPSYQLKTEQSTEKFSTTAKQREA